MRCLFRKKKKWPQHKKLFALWMVLIQPIPDKTGGRWPMASLSIGRIVFESFQVKDDMIKVKPRYRAF